MTITEHEHTEVVTEREQRARVLEAAALEIEVRGWTQGIACDEEGRVCLMGAIGCVLYGRLMRAIGCVLYGDAPLTDWLEIMDVWDHDWPVEFVRLREDGMLLPLARWNDTPERSAADVTFVLRWRAQEIRDGR